MGWGVHWALVRAMHGLIIGIGPRQRSSRYCRYSCPTFQLLHAGPCPSPVLPRNRHAPCTNRGSAGAGAIGQPAHHGPSSPAIYGTACVYVHYHYVLAIPLVPNDALPRCLGRRGQHIFCRRKCARWIKGSRQKTGFRAALLTKYVGAGHWMAVHRSFCSKSSALRGRSALLCAARCLSTKLPVNSPSTPDLLAFDNPLSVGGHESASVCGFLLRPDASPPKLLV